MTPSVERFDPRTHHFVLTISIIILIIIISPAPAARWTTVSVDSLPTSWQPLGGQQSGRGPKTSCLTGPLNPSLW